MPLTNKIGVFDFVTLHRPDDHGAPPTFVRMMTRTVQRDGVDGTGIILLGEKAEPCQLVSGVDLFARSDSLEVFERYSELIGDDAQKIIWAGIDFRAQYETQYVVLDVQPGRIIRLNAVAGGLNAGQFWTEALWTVQPVFAP